MNKINNIESLFKKYGYDNPIFISEFDNNTQMRQYLLRKSKEGKIRKYDRGIYYFPSTTLMGESELSPLQICISKYMGIQGEKGYISGLGFEYNLGISTQVPNIIEITTNETSSKKRLISIGNQKIILRKPYTTIDSNNSKSLQLLDFINKCNSSELRKNKNKIRLYIQENNLSQVLLRYLNAYPSTIYKKLIEGEIYVFAS